MKFKYNNIKNVLGSFAMGFIATNAFAANIDNGGVTWTWKTTDYGEGNNKAYITAVSQATDAANIPWTFTYDGKEYTVTELNGLAEKLSGTLALPDSVVYLHGEVFKNCSEMTGDISDLANVSKLGKNTFYNTRVFGDVRFHPELTAIPEGVFFNSRITSAYIHEGVTEIRKIAFKGSSLTNVVVPRSVTAIWENAFEKTQLKAVLIPGPATVESGEQTVAKFAVSNQFANCENLRTIVFGPNTTTNGADRVANRMARYNSNVTAFVPAGRDWDKECIMAENSTNKYYEYGPDEDLDLDIDIERKVITATVATEEALNIVLEQAPIFKDEFGMETRINVSSSLPENTLSSAVSTGAMFNYLIFTVKNQAQLDNVLAKFQTKIPIIIDIEGATEPLVISEDRFVAIRASVGWTFKKRDGMIIMYK